MQSAFQPRPGDLDRKLDVLFPDPVTREQARMALAGYGDEAWHREPERVRLAILYLARGDLDDVKRRVEAASVDYRDVIAAAEYPLLMGLPPDVDPESDTYRQALSSDEKRYRAWVDG